MLHAGDAAAGTVHIHADTAWPTDIAGQFRVLKNMPAETPPARIASLSAGPGGHGAPDSTLRLMPARPGSFNWLEIKLVNNSARPIVLRLETGISSPSAPRFLTEQNGVWKSGSNPGGSPTGPDAARSPTLRVALDADGQAQVLVRMENDVPVQLHPMLYSEAAYQATQAKYSLYNGLLLGGLLILGLGALLYAAFTRKPLPAVLGMLFLALLMYRVSALGYGPLHLWPQAGSWDRRSTGFFSHAVLALLIVFVQQLARQQNIVLPTRNWFRGLLALEAAMCVAALAADLSLARWVAPYSALVLGLLLVISSAGVFKSRARGRNLVLAAAIVAFVQLSMFAITQLGLLPHALLHFGIGATNTIPCAALASLACYVALLAAWFHHSATSRQSASNNLATWQDVEQRRLKEKVAQQTETLAKALQYATDKDRQKTEAINFISHDLRAPLATIIGYAQLLKQSQTQEQAKQIHAIERSANFQLSLIDDLLAYTKNEARPKKPAPALVRIADLMDDICQYATGLCVQQHNKFEYEAMSELPPSVLIDSRSLRQVLLNLLSNAAKYTRGGLVRLTVQATPDAGQWLLSFEVSDSGVGISPGQQSRIFGAFEQVKPQRHSSGLGLFIAQRAVEKLGGVLHVESSPMQGSTFSFQIRTHSVNQQTIQLQPDTVQELENLALSGLPVPPATNRIALAQMARDGHLSDIENWLAHMTQAYPDCAAFFDRIGQALETLNLEYIEALALSKTSG